MSQSLVAMKLTTALTLLAVAALTGCVNLAPQTMVARPPVLDSSELGAEGDPSQAPNLGPGGQPVSQPAPDPYKVTVFGYNGAKSKIDDVQPNLSLRQVVEDSGAIGWFGSVKVTIMRTPPGGGERHRIEVDIDGEVDDLHNYAVRPGDHIIIRKSDIKQDVVGEITDMVLGR